MIAVFIIGVAAILLTLALVVSLLGRNNKLLRSLDERLETLNGKSPVVVEGGTVTITDLQPVVSAIEHAAEKPNQFLSLIASLLSELGKADDPPQPEKLTPILQQIASRLDEIADREPITIEQAQTQQTHELLREISSQLEAISKMPPATSGPGLIQRIMGTKDEPEPQIEIHHRPLASYDSINARKEE